MTKRAVRIAARSADSDQLALRRASRIVGTRIAIVCSVIVLVVIATILLYILSKITPAELFEPVPDQDNLRIGAAVLLRDALALGVALIILAGVMSWLVTRHAVRPLGEALRIQRAFVADASHELRTPLAVLDARIQILQRTLSADDPASPQVAELRQDAKSLIQVVNDLLELAEEGAVNPQAPDVTHATDLVEAVSTAVQRMSLIGSDKQIAVTLDAPDSAHCAVPASSITRCTVALIDNALRFSSPQSEVTVSVVVRAKTVSVVVRDRGTGIQNIDPARIFDRFAHTGSSSGSRLEDAWDSPAGFGIGLSLVREIAVRHGGSVEVVESSTAGTAISFTVPRAEPR
ncbi:MAG: sensor histidine kinase [Microbacteriaceae bacterium]